MKTDNKSIKFSFLLPTRGRPELVKRFFQSIVDTTENLDELEIILCVDDDDIESQKISDDRLFIKKLVVPRGTTMGVLNRTCYEASTGRYVMGVNDDLILRTKGWDRIIADIFASFKDDIALIHVNDMLFKEKLCTFPVQSRKVCREIGYSPAEYKRYRIDDHIYDIYNMLAYLGHKRIAYLPDVIFEHDNFQHTHDGSSPAFVSEDKRIYVANNEIIEQDAKVFEAKLDERKNNALKLACLIEQGVYQEKKTAYERVLGTIKDSYSYRRSGFVKKISLSDKECREKPRVTIAVVTSDIYREHANKCLSLLKKYTKDFDLLVLDNNTCPDFNHPMEMNKVLSVVQTDYLVLMDDDVFVEEGWLDGMLRCIDKDTGMVSPLHKDRRGRLSYSGGYLLGDGTGTHRHNLDRQDKPRETQAACSACILIDMKKCGHLRFNTAYNKYFLDIDFTFQVWESGYKAVVTPESIVTHLGGATMPWSSKKSDFLYKRDEGIFLEIWIKSGRLDRIIKEIWSQFPFLRHICEVPDTIKVAFRDADNMDFDLFQNNIEKLIKEIKPLKLFHPKIVESLESQIIMSDRKGDKIRSKYCNKAISRLTGASWAFRMFILIIKKFLLKIARLITSNRHSYDLAVSVYAFLKKAFDGYLRLPSYIRKVTDGTLFAIGRAFVFMKDSQQKIPEITAPEIEGEFPVNFPQGGNLFICAFNRGKTKKYLEMLNSNIDNIVLLILKGHKNVFNGYQTVAYKDLFGKDSDIIDINNTSERLIRELKARNFDLVIIPYDNPINWRDTSLERFIAPFAKNFMIVFPDGKKILYTRYDDLNRITYNKAYLGRMFKFVPIPKGKKILDVGCSDGLVCDLLLNENPESVTGIDVLETVGENYKDPKITYFRMDAENLSFEDQSFDLTFSIATLEHCKDPLKVLQEMKRVTKKGGHCYVQAGPLYHSPFGHHMFGYFDDYPWIHLRLSKEEIIEYSRLHGIDKKIDESIGQKVEDYIIGMLNINHINGKKIKEYGLWEFMSAKDIEVIHFAQSYEGENLLTDAIINELNRYSKEDLTAHGFEFIFKRL